MTTYEIKFFGNEKEYIGITEEEAFDLIYKFSIDKIDWFCEIGTESEENVNRIIEDVEEYIEEEIEEEIKYLEDELEDLEEFYYYHPLNDATAEAIERIKDRLYELQ